jgi:transcriptional regulator with XRE-family HTH domain
MAEKPHLKTGARLKALRGELSQPDFAKKLGIPWRSYHRYEAGERVPPLEVLNRMVELRGSSVEWILTGHNAEGSAVETKGAAPPLEIVSRYRKLHQRLWRILEEGDASKIRAIQGQLQALDPQVKKKRKTGR